MKPVRIFGGTSGVNNIVDPVRLKTSKETGLSELAEASNVLIDNSGMPYRRPGYSLIDARPFSSVFCDGGDCFAVMELAGDAAIYKLGTDKSLTGVRSGLAKGLKMGWCQTSLGTYYGNGAQSGRITAGASYPWTAQTYVGPPTTRTFGTPPLGTHLALFSSSMCVVNGPIVSYSEPLGYGLFDHARSRMRFGSDVKMFKPVDNGVWASDSKRTYFLEGMNLRELVRHPRLECPAHEYSEATGYVNGDDLGISGAGECAVWSCDKGLCVGTSSGQLLVITDGKLNYPAGALGASLIFGDHIINTVQEYQCVATNLTSAAPSHFTGFAFNSFAKFNGSYFAAGPSGLYEILTGNSDAGAAIAANITTGATDMGAHQTKALRFIYLGIETSGKVRIVITADKQDAKTIVVTPTKTGAQRVRVPVGRDTRGRYWSFRIENMAGADLKVYEIETLPVILHSGRY